MSRNMAGAAVELGNLRGRIAVYLDEAEAIAMAEHYGAGDGFHAELLQAVEKAYPPALDADAEATTAPPG